MSNAIFIAWLVCHFEYTLRFMGQISHLIETLQLPDSFKKILSWLKFYNKENHQTQQEITQFLSMCTPDDAHSVQENYKNCDACASFVVSKQSNLYICVHKNLWQFSACTLALVHLVSCFLLWDKLDTKYLPIINYYLSLWYHEICTSCWGGKVSSVVTRTVAMFIASGPNIMHMCI